jgi:hypothetical protein
MWQDLVFAVGNVVFLITLLPIAFNPLAYVPRLSSVPITVTLTAFVVAFASLGFAWSAVCAASTAVCWGFIAAKRGTHPSKEVSGATAGT